MDLLDIHRGIHINRRVASLGLLGRGGLIGGFALRLIRHDILTTRQILARSTPGILYHVASKDEEIACAILTKEFGYVLWRHGEHGSVILIGDRHIRHLASLGVGEHVHLDDATRNRIGEAFIAVAGLIGLDDMHVIARVSDRGHDVRGVEIEDIDGGGHSADRIDWGRSKQSNGDSSAI